MTRKEDMAALRADTQVHYNCARTENGSIDCAALLRAAYERGEEKKPHCDRMVQQCVDFVCRETGLE